VDFSLVDRPLLAVTEIEEHLYHLDTRGFTVVHGFLPHDIVVNLKAAFLSIVSARAVGSNDPEAASGHHIHDLLARDIRFARLLEDPRLDQLLAPMLGPNWILYAFTTSSLPPRGVNYGSRIHVDSPRLIAGYPTNVGVIWALDDFSTDNGATELLPGSHHSTKVPALSLFSEHCASIRCSSGAAVLFHARVFHRAGVNQTDAWRHSLTMNCCRPFMKQRMDWVRMVPNEIADAMNERGRRVLGYHSRVPGTMAEYNLPEDQRLYRAGQE
jgi:hypothetical protein